MTNNRWLFIVNPASANGTGGQKWDALERALQQAQIPIQVWHSEYHGHIEQLVDRACHEGYRKLASFGGDGSLSALVNGVMTQKSCPTNELLLAHYPSGTGNDWCRFFKVPTEPKQWVEVLKHDLRFAHDVGIIDLMKNGVEARHYFVNIAGVAYESMCAVLIEKARKGSSLPKGKWFYDYIVFKGLLSFQAPELILKYNGKRSQQKIFNLCVAICRYNGGGMLPAPFADPTDGIFDVTTFEDMPKWMVIRDYPKLRAGTIFKNPKIKAFRTTGIFIDKVGGADHVEADGEYVGQTPATFSTQQKALQFVIGAVPEHKAFPF